MNSVSLALLISIFAWAPFTASLRAALQPNLIIILADDLGYGDLGCYGHPQFKTPRLDRMAAEGARLIHFNCPAPFCAPTRASLMTGRYPSGDFAKRGLRDGHGGKMALGPFKKAFFPNHRGFDEYLGILYSNDMRPVELIDGESVVEYPVVQATLTQRYTQRALAFMERNKDKPFFFYFAHAMPHKPLAASEHFYKKSGAGLYGDTIAELDASVGQVLTKVKELGLDERTLIVFTSDNGPWYGGITGGLRGMKGTSWEGGYRVPFIARWPGKIPAGHISSEPAVMMDLFATALKIAGANPQPDRTLDGFDILPLLTSEAKSPHEVIFGHQGPRLSTVRDARWKLHVLAPNQRSTTAGQRWIDPRGPDGVTLLAPYEQYQPTDFPGLTTGDSPQPMSLFDLSTDPGEQHNVATEHPDVVRRLKARYDEVAGESSKIQDPNSRETPKTK